MKFLIYIEGNEKVAEQLFNSYFKELYYTI